MAKIVDGRGKSCPIPVIMTKKEIEKTENELVKTIVDNEVAKENVSKLAKSLGYNYTTEDISEEEFHISIEVGEADLSKVSLNDDRFKDITLAFSTDVMGEGNRELGEVLIKSYMYTVAESEPYPKSMIFFNTGVNLTCEGSEVLDDLVKLEEEGVEIISCGTCLDFLGRQDDVKVGSVSNMYTIYEKLREPKSNIIL